MRPLLPLFCPIKRNFATLAAATASTLALTILVSTAQPSLAQTSPQRPTTSLPTIDLYVGMHRLKTEVAIDPPDRATGLMWRKSLPDNQGMLFIFESYAIHCFWMRNTFIPLSIAFLRDDGSIVNIEDMQPQQDTSHCPAEPVRYALEVNQGWFAKRNIEPSMTIRGLPNPSK